MGLFRKKPIVVEAHRWFKNGDHPQDGVCTIHPMSGEAPGSEPFLSEGKVVRRYNRPDVDGRRRCLYCNKQMQRHGWIDTLEGGHRVCPGDWIITGASGEHYPCKDEIFRATYEPAEETAE